MLDNTNNSANKMSDKALEYLNNNYDDTFEVLGFTPSNWAYSYATVSFSSEKFSGDTVSVRIYSGDNGYSYSDDYYKLTMLADAEMYFEKQIKEYVESVEVKVSFISSRLPETIPTTATFDDYIQSGKCHMQVYFIITCDLEEEIMMNIVEQIANDKIFGYVDFWTTKDEQLLKEYDISEIVNKKADSIIGEESYIISNAYEITK